MTANDSDVIINVLVMSFIPILLCVFPGTLKAYNPMAEWHLNGLKCVQYKITLWFPFCLALNKGID